MEPDQKGMRGHSSVFSLFFTKKYLTKSTDVLEHCRELETKSWSSIFEVFPCDCIPKATKNVNVHFFNHSNNFCKFYQRIPGKFFEPTNYVYP